MAPDRWSSIPSTPEVVTLAALAVATALPLAVVGLSTATGWDVGRGGALGGYWLILGVLAAGSLFATPYGTVLGVATLPVAARIDAGYGTPTGSGGFTRSRDHVAGAVLYAALTTFAAGAVLWTAIRLRPATTVQRLGAAVGVAALLVGGLLVAATFLAAQLHHRRDSDDAVAAATVGWYALYAAGLLPAPFGALAVLTWLLPAVDLLDLVVLYLW